MLCCPVDRVFCLTETFPFHEIPLINCWYYGLRQVFCSENCHFYQCVQGHCPLPLLLSLAYMVLCCGSWSTWTWIFLQGDKCGSIWIFLHEDIQLVQYHLLKMLSVFQCLVLNPLSKKKMSCQNLAHKPSMMILPTKKKKSQVLQGHHKNEVSCQALLRRENTYPIYYNTVKRYIGS